MLDIALVGTGGMMPMPERFLSSAIIRVNGRLILIDSGEGTQVSLKKIGWGFKAIDAIIFTHYHADHISGLVGMLLAIANAGREDKLKLYGPKGLSYVVEGLLRIAQDISYEIECIELEEFEKFNVCGIDVTSIPAVHSVKCFAYGFELKRKGKFNSEKAEELGIPKKLWSVIQREGKIEYNGKIITEDMVMGEERKGIKVTYCTDSRPFDELVKLAEGSELLVCEGIYGENEKKQKAMEKKHMIFAEAATVAKNAKVKELWLTHFSPALSEPEEFIENATSIFENTVVGSDGLMKTIYFEN